MSSRLIASLLLLCLVSGCTGLRSAPSSPDIPPVLAPGSPEPVQADPKPELRPELFALPEVVEPAQQKPIRRSAAEDNADEAPAEVLLRHDRKLVVDSAVGSMPSVKRAVHLMLLENDQWHTVSSVNLPYLIGNTVLFTRQSLPGYPNAVVIETRRDHGVRRGAVAIDGEQLIALDYYRLIAPDPEVIGGVYLHLNKYLNELWVYRNGELIAMFPTANGRDPGGPAPTWSDYKTNYKTPEGQFLIKQKIVNPPYRGFGSHPPAAGGAANNPLGTRWTGFEGLPGDGGGIWAFHGTYVPDQIGTWASEGCVRLNTADAENLYSMVPYDATLRVVSGW